MNDAIRAAIVAGELELATAKAERLAEEQRKQDEATLARHRLLAAGHKWVQNVLPELIRVETAKGLRRLDLGSEDYDSFSGVRERAEACRAIGLTVQTSHYSASNSGDYGDYGPGCTYVVVW